MAEILAGKDDLPYIPDDVLLPQFLLDMHHPLRPVQTTPQAWLVEEATRRKIGSDELRARTHGLANALKLRWNLGEDDVACIFSPNHVGRSRSWAASSRRILLGASFVLCLIETYRTSNPLYTAEELAHQLELSKTRLLFVHPAMLTVAAEAAHAVGLAYDRIVLFDPIPASPHSNVQELIKFGLGAKQEYAERRLKPGEARTKLALLLFSSGTTGKPKAVMISHYGLVANIVQVAQYIQVHDGNVPPKSRHFRVGDVSLGDAYGLHFVLFFGMFAGLTIVVSPKYSLERMLQSIQQYRVTHLWLVPPQAIMICKLISLNTQSPAVQDYDLSSVQFVACGAAPVSGELTDQLTKVLPNALVGQGYGMTETSTMITFCQLDKRIGTPGCAGLLIPGVEARVVKVDGTLAQFGEPGELHLRSPALSLGYYDNPTATAETFKDGWLHTGDEVKLNENGEVFVVDRIKELIKVRGFQVAPSELEGHLLDHPDVADVCVVGIPDDYSGELPFAFIVLNRDAQARVQGNPQEKKKVKERVMKHVSDHKTHFKWLAGVEFVDAIPKNPSGKLLRRVLREQAKTMLASGKLSTVPKARL
nr:4-coumarate:CoA ligase [Ganoderma lucidum]